MSLVRNRDTITCSKLLLKSLECLAILKTKVQVIMQPILNQLNFPLHLLRQSGLSIKTKTSDPQPNQFVVFHDLRLCGYRQYFQVNLPARRQYKEQTGASVHNGSLTPATTSENPLPCPCSTSSLVNALSSILGCSIKRCVNNSSYSTPIVATLCPPSLK